MVQAVAPVSGRLLKLMPHAYIVATADNVGILVHLGIDTVQLKVPDSPLTRHRATRSRRARSSSPMTFLRWWPRV